MKIIAAVLASFRAKAAPAVNKARLWLTPSFWKNKALTKLRSGMKKLLDVRPADESDYYALGGLYVGKKLAAAGVLAAGLLCFVYIMAMLPEKGRAEEAYRVYRYLSLPLKFQSGKVGILGRSGYLAYVGEVDAGAANGQGVLYDPGGNKVYEGQFESSRYNGEGIRYYKNSSVLYQGGFRDNQYEGEGSLYREDGTKEYEGGFHLGKKEGAGVLYGGNGDAVFQGNFNKDEIIYKEFLNKTTEEAAAMYTGRKHIYMSDSDYCVSMKDIGAVYAFRSGLETLEEEWTIEGVYVLSGSALLEGKRIEDIAGLVKNFGEPEYEGNAALSTADAAAVAEASSYGEVLSGRPELQSTAIFEDVTQIDAVSGEYLVYLYRYELDGCAYTFFCSDKNKGFDLYLIEEKE